MLGSRYVQSLLIPAFVAALAMPAQSSDESTPKSAPGKSTARVVTLNGCVAGDSGHYVLSDAQGRTTYKLNGGKMRNYIGRRVQISGVPPRRLRISGGLYP